MVCGGKLSLTGRAWLRLVPLLSSLSDDAKCVSRNPVLLELVSAGRHRKGGLNLSELLKIP